MISSSPKEQLTTKNLSTENTDIQSELNLYYTISEVLVALLAVVGNAMVIIVFNKERKLRRRTNYYIVSLAVADFLVGLLGIPFAILAFVGLPRHLYACLFTVSLLVVLCTISIFCLVAVSVDRYWAILYPMGYSKHVRTKTTRVIISVCWLAGSIIGFLPLMGWHKDVPVDAECYFLDVMDYNYLVFLYFTTIITPALLLAAFYTHIYRVVLRQLRTIVTMNPESAAKNRKRGRAIAGGTMLRVLGAAQKREVKATQNLSIIVLFFMICWIPLYTINFILAFCEDCIETNSTMMLLCIILSHLNSAGNPILYAYHLRDFRAALKHFLCGLFGKTSHSSILNTGINCRPSLASNMDGNYSNYRLNSLREMQSLSSFRNNRSSDYQTSSNGQFGHRGGKLLSEHSGISTIVKGTAAVAVVAASAGDSDRKIWRISEVPSCLENGPSQENSSNSSSSIREKGNVFERRKTFSSSSSSGKVNSGFVKEFGGEEGDDDVFIDDFIPTEDEEDSRAESVENLTQSNKIVISPPQKRKSSQGCGSSPQLSKNLFLVEDEIKSGVLNDGFYNKNCKQGFLLQNGLKHSVSGDGLEDRQKTTSFNLLKAASRKFISSETAVYSGSKGPP